MHRILTYVVQDTHFKFQRTISTNASKLILAVFGKMSIFDPSVPENLQATWNLVLAHSGGPRGSPASWLNILAQHPGPTS